jgi:hypothetical protein
MEGKGTEEFGDFGHAPSPINPKPKANLTFPAVFG